MAAGLPLTPPRNAGDSPDYRGGSQKPCLSLSAFCLEQRLSVCLPGSNIFQCSKDVAISHQQSELAVGVESVNV